MIRTKILATMGPAVGTPQALYELFEAGADACRLNFSHGPLERHLETLRNIREAAARWNQPVAILGDLCGPKIRLGKIADLNNTGGLPIDTGEDLIFQRGTIVGHLVDGVRRVSSIYPHLVDDVNVGDRVLIEDGLLRFVCTEKTFGELRCRCTSGGILKSSKGINLPNTKLNTASITDRDWECVEWAIENDLDYLALSFVRNADDLNLLREHLRNHQSSIQLIAKIEMAEALDDIDRIMDASDGVMVARGDLGVEVDLARVPIIQKDLIRRCRNAAKPCIVATQMLQSMVDNSSPTRAEVSDVANAIFDATDAVMLSGETSVGKFPIGAVVTMSRVAEVTEEYLDSQPLIAEPQLKLRTKPLSAAVAKGVREIATTLAAKLVVVYSQTGATAQIFSKYRFTVPIVALSSDHRALRRMALHYGVIPQEMAPPGDFQKLVDEIDMLIIQREFTKLGDRVIIVGGSSLGTPGTMNAIVVHTVGERQFERFQASDLVAEAQ